MGSDLFISLPYIFWACVFIFLLFLPKLKQKFGKGYVRFLAVTGGVFCTGFVFGPVSHAILIYWKLQWRNSAEGLIILITAAALVLFFAALILLLITKLKANGAKRGFCFLLIAVLILFSLGTIWLGLLGISWGNFHRETVIEVQGMKYVKVENTFLIEQIQWYSYHGPFLMGMEEITLP